MYNLCHPAWQGKDLDNNNDFIKIRFHIAVIGKINKIQMAWLSSWPINWKPFNHRVDSVIESSLRKIIGSKNFALINLSLNFCETTIYDNKVFLENLVAVH